MATKNSNQLVKPPARAKARVHTRPHTRTQKTDDSCSTELRTPGTPVCALYGKGGGQEEVVFVACPQAYAFFSLYMHKSATVA